MLKKFIKAILLKNNIVRSRILFENNILFNKNITTIVGTIRAINDQDDAWFCELSKHHHNIMDIGCNVGFMSIIAKLNNPNSKIILVDPNPQALELAFKNMLKNKLTSNVNFINAFVGDNTTEDVKFYSLTTDQSGSIYKGSAQSAAMVNSFYYVQSTTINQICEQNNFKPDFIKVDVEGAESLVLLGSSVIALKYRPIFLVEMHAPEEMPMYKNATLVLDWCKGVDYTPYYMANHTILSNPSEIAHRGKCHLLLIPKGTDYPIYLKNISQGSLI
jgi:FkbM family methyltransferase